MRAIGYARWHLALVTGLLACVVWVPWQVVVIAVIAIMCDLSFRADRDVTEARIGASEASVWGSPRASQTTAAASTVAVRPADRLPISLVRLLGADCPACHGLGCVGCEHTGLG